MHGSLRFLWFFIDNILIRDAGVSVCRATYKRTSVAVKAESKVRLEIQQDVLQLHCWSIYLVTSQTTAIGSG